MAAGAPFPGEERYVRECITDVAWWSSARRGGSVRHAVPGDCPGLWRLMAVLKLGPTAALFCSLSCNENGAKTLKGPILPGLAKS
ncbi:putative serpin-like protein [Gossypium arboreum]|nr:putative serpin-like protein [Gossypium arboreum]